MAPWPPFGLFSIILFLLLLPLFYFASFFIGRRFNKHFNDIPDWHFQHAKLFLHATGISTHSIKTYIYIQAIALGNDKPVFKRNICKYTNRDFKQYARKWEVIYCQFLFVLHWVALILLSFNAIVYKIVTH